jgi:hypothetical protein
VADDKPSLIKLGPGAKLTHSTITDNTVVGDANLINNEGTIENSEIERNKLLQYPGDPTWVDKEYDPHFAQPAKEERFSVLRSIWAWLKDKVLGGIIVGVVVGLAIYYMTKAPSTVSFTVKSPVAETPTAPSTEQVKQ